MLEKEYVNPEGVYEAPWKFNQAVKIKLAGATIVFISGIVARQEDGSILDGDIVAQCELAFQNLQKVVEAAGGTMADLVKTNWYIGEDYRINRDRIREVSDRYFPTDYPANTLMEVAGFANVDYNFEIEGIAIFEE